MISRVLSAKDRDGHAVRGGGELRRVAGRPLRGRPQEQVGVVRAGDGEVDKVQAQLAHVRLALANLEAGEAKIQIQ